MKKIAKFLMMLLVVVTLAVSGVSIAERYRLIEKVELSAKKHLQQVLSISRELQDLQATLAEVMQGKEDIPDAFPVGGKPEDSEVTTEDLEDFPNEAVTEAETEPVTAPPVAEDAETSEAGSDEPSDDFPETSDETTEAENTTTDTASGPSYIIRADEGIIRVFTAEGDPVMDVNVSVITLPEADRRALAEGIPAASMEEVRQILDKLA